jgi:hypothetical protein
VAQNFHQALRTSLYSLKGRRIVSFMSSHFSYPRIPRIVPMGHCHTCGKDLEVIVDPIEFIDINGNDLDSIKISAHCGKGGHNMYSRYIDREEFLTFPEAQIYT